MKELHIISSNFVKAFNYNENCFETVTAQRSLKDNVIIIESTDKDEINSLLESLGKEQRVICSQAAYSSNMSFVRRGNTIYLKHLDDASINDGIECLKTLRIINKNQYLIGSSAIMTNIRERIVKYAKANEPIHLYGETGVGKNLAAQMVHFHSGKTKSMVYENCAHLQSSLKGSRLFGHIKGSFTGATADRKGLFGMAHGTTIFLDEFETLDLHTQAELLDVIESGQYKKIGSDKQLYSSFRLITASNERLDDLAENGKIRKDLLYRINPLSIELPPLREHREDIPELVDYYEFQRDIVTNRFTDFESLDKHDFKGNVRELFSLIRSFELSQTL